MGEETQSCAATSSTTLNNYSKALGFFFRTRTSTKQEIVDSGEIPTPFRLAKVSLWWMVRRIDRHQLWLNADKHFD